VSCELREKKKGRMQRLGDPTGESVGRPSPMDETSRNLLRRKNTALDKHGFQK